MMLAYDEPTPWRRPNVRMHAVHPLRERIAEAWRRFRDLDGDLGVSLDTFVAHVSAAVTERVGDASGAEERAVAVLERLVLRDVYLVLGCLAGHPNALRLFDERFGRYLRKLSREYAPYPDLVEDVEAEMLCTMFQPKDADGGEARLARYQGMGSLQGWLRVAVRRLAIDMARSRANRPTATPEGDESLARVETGWQSTDEALVERDAVGRLRAVLGACVGELSGPEQALMRAYYRDGFVLRELAEREGCDITSIHRRLAAIRKRIWGGLKRRAEHDLGLDERDLRQLVGQLAESVDLDDLFATCMVLCGPRGALLFGSL
jgi:RNA polymerase sigma-70 factor